MSDDKKIISFTDAKRQKEQEDGHFEKMDTELPPELNAKIEEGNAFIEELHNALDQTLASFMKDNMESRQPSEIVEAIGRLAISVLKTLDNQLPPEVSDNRTVLRQSLGYHAIDTINFNAANYSQTQQQPVFSHDILISAFIGAITGAYEQRIQFTTMMMNQEESSDEKPETDD